MPSLFFKGGRIMRGKNSMTRSSDIVGMWYFYDDIVVIAKKLKKLRIEHDLTLKDVSNKLCWNIDCVKNWENTADPSPPDPRTMIRLAKFYDVSEEYLYSSDMKMDSTRTAFPPPSEKIGDANSKYRVVNFIPFPEGAKREECFFVYEDTKLLGKKLKKLREGRNLTIEEFRKEIRYYDGYVREWESGEVPPLPDTMTKLAKFYNIDEEYLWSPYLGKGKQLSLF